MKFKNLLQGMLACSLLCSLVVIQACDDDDEPKDTQAPEVTFTDLIEDMTVWNTVSISLEATDDQGINEIQVFADGNLITTLTASPFETSWDSNTVTDGEHTLKVIVTDKSGNSVEKEISVNVLNTLVTINVAADQLYSETDFSERGFVFLSDENGNVIAHQEYQNGNTIVFKSSTFNGEKFFLSEALVETRPGDDLVRLWTFAQIERGKTWVVMDDREDDDETYAGEANLKFTNLNVNSRYFAVSNGEDAYAEGLDTESTIGIRPNSKLYVTRDIIDEENVPIAYNLYPNIVVGDNTINLNLVNKQLTKVTISLPSDSEGSTTRITAYPVANTFTDPYSIGYHSSGTDVLTYDIYYPGTAFPTYYTESDYETPSIYYSRASTSQTFSLPQITNDIDFTFAANKLTYSATGDFDFFSTQYSGAGDDGPYWSFILPEGTNQIIPAIKLPTELSSFTVPDFGLPPHYTVYAFDEITDYDGLKTFIRSSTRSTDALYNKGKNYVEIVYKNPNFGGRVKSTGFVKAFGKIKKR
jgi:hypothetical protein